jgi:nucleoid DNA-binding protein
MTKGEIERWVAKRVGIHNRDIRPILALVYKAVRLSLLKCEEVRIDGVGKLIPVVRKGGSGRKNPFDPNNKERVQYPAHMRVVFKPSVGFKARLKEKTAGKV